MNCNRCGECCRKGGTCFLRGESWSLQKLSLKFEGVCSLLLDSGECSVLQNVAKQKDSERLFRFAGIKGECDFPELRIESASNHNQ